MNFPGNRCCDYFLAKLSIILFFGGVAATAIGGPVNAAGDAPSWLEHWDLARVLITALFAIIAWFLIHVLNKFDTNQSEMFDRLNSVEKEQARQRGYCDAITTEAKHTKGG